MRIAIIGSPRAGKTTLAYELSRSSGLPILHCDELIGLGWSGASDEMAKLLTCSPNVIAEGMGVVRALRKMLEASVAPPVERCIVLERQRVPLSRGQLAMQAGAATILRSIEQELLRRGVVVERP